ncbi:bacteriohemerythrin [Thiothrix lacustris]|uniref:Hemerythrin family protein n=1 Tax=Thiothrix lacustris TaxID=525917 RepID=A0ABY9MTR4_9GAMM|nr:hemerythrin family protein [Thiothrix lacustris]WML92054.1 hemerythrin family protein [Thiothrix lacustris]WMP16129.1 hemerythrin family protein [Thiothrix lacustris]
MPTQIDANTFMLMEIPAMTQVHEEERIMLNELYTLLAQALTDAPLIDIKLDALLQHTTAHFEQENRNMLIIDFRPYPVHKDEHDLALADMKTAFDHWKISRNLPALRQYLETDLPAWLKQHIATMDMITARFLKMYQDKGGALDFA